MVHNRHNGMDLLVKWVPGHVDIVGNVRADAEAKKAATIGSSPLHRLPAPLRKTLPWSKSATRQEYHRKIKWAANKLWASSPTSGKSKFSYGPYWVLLMSGALHRS